MIRFYPNRVLVISIFFFFIFSSNLLLAANEIFCIKNKTVKSYYEQAFKYHDEGSLIKEYGLLVFVFNTLIEGECGYIEVKDPNFISELEEYMIELFSTINGTYKDGLKNSHKLKGWNSQKTDNITGKGEAKPTFPYLRRNIPLGRPR